MKNLVICCVASALAGGIVAAWLVSENPAVWPTSHVAQAQESFGPSGADSGYAAAPDQGRSVRPDPALLASSTRSALDPALTPEELTNIHVYEGANRGVVNILTKVVSYDRFFMLPTPGEGAGSGSVIDKQGHILTNNHVIEDARAIQVTLPSGKSFQAELVGADPAQDVAVLKIDAPPSELYPIPIGRSDNLRVGQRVYTLGNPFGLEGTLTTGIISNLNPNGCTHESRQFRWATPGYQRPDDWHERGDSNENWAKRGPWVCHPGQPHSSDRARTDQVWEDGTSGHRHRGGG
jgi:S1-C subfamily serine protease